MNQSVERTYINWKLGLLHSVLCTVQKTIMNPLVDGKLRELCFSAKQKDVYFSKTTLGPSGL